ncbi:ESF1-like [Oopsacas minuta]|uniref:ESF1-like n=1 Tax=Oopsacas minuta TaxID=111878 RepID=A0AAV7K8C5_9METZ|nr:ESF1-like [Oopsacas minuta]
MGVLESSNYYYYCITETDSNATSDYLYEECNGIEYELSGTRLDLRVVPDDMEFTDTEATSVATPDSLPVDYQPSSFYNSALQHTKVHLTWDETDPDRQKILNQNFSKTDIREMDFQAYLASGSESDESSGGEENGVISEDKTLAKFKSILTELDTIECKESSKKDDDIDLEITWEPGKLAPLEEAISKKTGEDETLTQWEEYLQKRKEKKKIKRNINREKNVNSDEEDQTKIESVFTELGGKKKKKSKPLKDTITESGQKERGELELLMVSDSEGEGNDKKHFNMKEIWKNNTLSQRKKRKLAKKGKEKQQDDFKIDLNDTRFERLLESPMYAPDPSDPQFHQGRNLQDIINERKRRREIQISQGTSNKKHRNIGDDSMSKDQIELLALVRKLKQKSQKPRPKKLNT